MPTQLVSNEEYLPRPQTQQQKQVEYLIGVMAEEKSKKLGMDRRAFMASTMGLATCFAASNKVYGKAFDVDDQEMMEPAAYHEKWPRGEYFIFDVQSHFTHGVVLGFRNLEFIRNMGFNLKEDVEAYSFKNFVKEMFFDSETDIRESCAAESGFEIHHLSLRDSAPAGWSGNSRTRSTSIRRPAISPGMTS